MDANTYFEYLKCYASDSLQNKLRSCITIITLYRFGASIHPCLLYINKYLMIELYVCVSLLKVTLIVTVLLLKRTTINTHFVFLSNNSFKPEKNMKEIV